MQLLSKKPEIEPLPLILPGTLEYMLASANLGLFPGAMNYVHERSGDVAFIARPGSGGLLEAVSLDEFQEFVNDGEADVRQAELEQEWALEDEMFVYEL